MKYLSPADINDFLFDLSNGFLMRFRGGEGIDQEQLKEFFEILEQLRRK